MRSTACREIAAEPQRRSALANVARAEAGGRLLIGAQVRRHGVEAAVARRHRHDAAVLQGGRAGEALQPRLLAGAPLRDAQLAPVRLNIRGQGRDVRRHRPARARAAVRGQGRGGPRVDAAARGGGVPAGCFLRAARAGPHHGLRAAPSSCPRRPAMRRRGLTAARAAVDQVNNNQSGPLGVASLQGHAAAIELLQLNCCERRVLCS